MRETWFSDHVGGGHSKFIGAKKRSCDGGELNTLIYSTMAKDLKLRKSIKLRLRKTLT